MMGARINRGWSLLLLSLGSYVALIGVAGFVIMLVSCAGGPA